METVGEQGTVDTSAEESEVRAKKRRGLFKLYRPDYPEKVRQLAAKGWTNDDIATFFMVPPGVLSEWRVEYPAFDAAFQRGRDVVDNRVEATLEMCANGYWYDDEETHIVGGQIVHVSVKRYSRPDPRACMMWLVCRRPQEWRRKSAELDFKEPGDTAARFTGYERARRLAFLMTQQPATNGDASKPH